MRGIRILLLGLAILLLGQTGVARAKDGKRPNIMLIVADDIGYTDLGSYGSEIPTPNLDRLAARGARFSDFHTGMTCSPTRAMLLSGVDHHLAGLGNMAGDISPNQKDKPGFEGYLNFQVAALPEILKQAGYRTFMAGKWHLGGSDTTSPAGRGFDHSFSLIDGGAGHFATMMPLVGPGKASYRDGNRSVEALPDDFYSTRFYTDKLLEYLAAGSDEERERPFFAYLAFTAPHWPIQAPEESLARFAGQYEDGYDALFERRLAAARRLGLAPSGAQGAARAPQGRSWDSLTPAERHYEARKMQAFAAMVSDLDIHVGRVLDWLERTGQQDNTIIMFMSDNGYEGHDLRHGFTEAADYAQTFDNSLERIGKPDSYIWMGPDWGRASSAPFRLYKGYPTEGGTRVPFLVSYPGLKRSGLVTARGHVSDVMPTLLDLAGIKHPGTRFAGRKVYAMSGRSMVPYLSNRVPQIHAASAPFAQELFGKRAIRVGRWKAIEMAAPYGTGRWELFDVAADPAERNDLAATDPKRLKKLTAQWQQWAKRSNVILPDTVTGY